MAQCGHVEMTTHWLLSLSIAIIASVSMFIYPMTFPKFRMEELLIKRNMSMANQECNHVNHFELETKSTPGWEKFMQPYQSNHKSVVRLYQKKHFKELDMTSILSFLLFLVVFFIICRIPLCIWQNKGLMWMWNFTLSIHYFDYYVYSQILAYFSYLFGGQPQYVFPLW
jgi:hypothetical protein